MGPPAARVASGTNGNRTKLLMHRIWLTLPETERIRLVRSHHAAAREKVRNVKAHASMHVTVENQIASWYGPSKRAVARLQSQGLSRHEARHAIAFVAAQFIYELNNGQNCRGASFVSVAHERDYRQLHAEVWLSEAGRKS
jgi:hypothetical protein